MSGWIKVQYALWDRPELVRIASACKVERATAHGACVRTWCLADQFSEDGRLEGYSAETLDCTVGVPGFAQAMEAVGWLEIEPEAVIITRFEKHHGPGAKRRALDAKRKRCGKKSAQPPAKTGNNSASHAEGKRPRDRDRETNTPPPTSSEDDAAPRNWRAVEEELAKLGMGEAGGAARAAWARGMKLEDVRSLIRQFRDGNGAYGLGALYGRLVGKLAAWPPPDPEHERQQRREECKQRAAQLAAQGRAERWCSEDERAERERREHAFGSQLDSMSREDVDALFIEVEPDPERRKASSAPLRRHLLLQALDQRNGELAK